MSILGPAIFFCGRPLVTMAMSSSELTRHIQEQAIQFISRNKCVDSSLMTRIVQAKASSVSAPQIILGVQGGCVVISGNGTGGEYINILQAAEAAAIGAPCSNTPTDTGVVSGIVLPVPCINYAAPPFTQQNLSTMYVAPCTNPGKVDYFPSRLSNGPGCTTTKITTPS